MKSSNIRTFIFSLPSLEAQSPKSHWSTFRVGLGVMGTSNSQPVKASTKIIAAMRQTQSCSIRFTTFIGAVRVMHKYAVEATYRDAFILGRAARFRNTR